ncbi:MAG: WD40 repeat domain-containing protein [Sphingobacterium sp.]
MNSKQIDVTLAATLTGHQNPIFALALDFQGTTLFTGGNDKGVVEWDLTSFSFKRILCKVDASIYSLLRIPDSPWLAVGLRSGEVLIVDIHEQSLKARLHTQSGAVFSIQYIPGKKELIAIGEEGTAYVWTVDGFQQLYRFKVSETTVRVIAISEDANQLAFGDKNGQVYLYSASDFQLIQKQTIHSMPVTSLLFNRGSLLSGGRDAKLFRLHARTLHVEHELVPHMFTVYGLAPGKSGELIASASRDKTLKIWDHADLRLVKNISRDRGYDSHLLSINNLLWRGDYIFTVSDDKTIRVWRVDG